jgi:hypothetical protein
MMKFSIQSIAESALWATSVGSALACWAGAIRLRSSKPTGKYTPAMAATLIIVLSGVSFGLVALGATIASPQTNHMRLAAILWAASALPPALACLIPNTKP